MQKAFTLLELLVVLLLISLSLALIGPRLGGIRPSPKETFPEKLKDLLDHARTLSQTKKRNYLVIFEEETRRVILKEALPNKEGALLQELKVPEEVELKAEGLLDLEEAKGLIFLGPYGSSSGGEIEIVNHQEGKNYLLRVSSLLPLTELLSLQAASP